MRNIVGNELSEESPARWDSGIVLSQAILDSWVALQRTLCGSISQQSISTGLMRGQIGEEPAESAFRQVRESWASAQLNMWISSCGPNSIWNRQIASHRIPPLRQSDRFCLAAHPYVNPRSAVSG
jgi:hypothetical protein